MLKLIILFISTSGIIIRSVYQALLSQNRVVNVDGMKMAVITGNALMREVFEMSIKTIKMANANQDSKVFQLATIVCNVMQTADAPVANTIVTYNFPRNFFSVYTSFAASPVFSAKN